MSSRTESNNTYPLVPSCLPSLDPAGSTNPSPFFLFPPGGRSSSSNARSVSVAATPSAPRVPRPRRSSARRSGFALPTARVRVDLISPRHCVRDIASIPGRPSTARPCPSYRPSFMPPLGRAWRSLAPPAGDHLETPRSRIECTVFIGASSPRKTFREPPFLALPTWAPAARRSGHILWHRACVSSASTLVGDFPATGMADEPPRR